MSALSDASTTTKKRLEDFMEEPMRKNDVIALSRFPDSHKRQHEEPLPIERDDWPAPAATAAAFPELREQRMRTQDCAPADVTRDCVLMLQCTRTSGARHAPEPPIRDRDTAGRVRPRRTTSSA